MLNIRTIIFSVGLMIVFLLAAQFVTAETEAASNPSSAAASLPDDDNPSSNPGYMGTIGSYRALPDKCFDVPLREAAACRETSQTTNRSYRSPLDECFDVSIREVASCHDVSRAPTP